MLKPDRNILEYRNEFFMNSTGEEGFVLVSYTGAGVAGSGAAMDNANMVVEVANAPSGRLPIGVLLNNVVNKDLTHQTLNPYKSEVQLGNKVAVGAKGVVVTNAIQGGTTTSIYPGQPAYLAGTGTLSSVPNPVQAPLVGRFLSRVDEQGFARVMIDL